MWWRVQLFKKEEQNFVFANEIDNMALIMPSQDKHAAMAAPVQGKADGKGKVGDQSTFGYSLPPSLQSWTKIGSL